MAIDATAGGAASNSYATVAEADAYFAQHLYASGWVSSTSAQKEAALVMATRILDGMPGAWTGEPAGSVQALRWPREGMLNRNGFPIADNVIPVQLKQAESELAGQLTRNDPAAAGVAQAMGLVGLKIEGLSLTFKDDEVTQGEAPAYLEDPARRVGVEGMVPASVIVLLVPSWLIDKRTADAPFRGLVVETL